MTELLVAGWLALGAYAVYLAALTIRNHPDPGDYLDAGGRLPGWSFCFAGAGIALAALVPYAHLQFAAHFGLAYQHVALGLVVAALVATLFHKRLWLAARITGSRGLADLLGLHYRSVAVRITIWCLTLLFTLPFAARMLGHLGDLAVAALGHEVERATAVWVLAFMLFLPAVIGGWRGMVYGITAQTTLGVVLLTMVAVAGAVHLDWAAGLLASAPGNPASLIPGVMQYSGGIGAGEPSAVWTTLGIFSFTLAIAAIMISPAVVLLVTSTDAGGQRTFAFTSVWMIAGAAMAALMLVTPLLAAGLVATQGSALALGYAALASVLIGLDPLLSVVLFLGVGVTLQLFIALLAQSGASLLVMEVLGRYVLPDLSPRGRRFAGRMAVTVIFLMMALLASTLPVMTAALASVTLPLAIQALPALLGLCWVRWISRSAVLTGIIVGSLLVIFTEPLGLIIFSALFVELPWGRWPWTIHSALWGLTFNVAAVLLVSIFTRGGEERLHRDRLHDRFRAHHTQDFGGPAARGAKWSLTLLWAFFAIGPGAIIGNSVFSRGVIQTQDATLAMPSLYVWQITFWLIGVFIVWWLAYQARLGVVETKVAPPLDLDIALPAFHSRVPGWIATSLQRFADIRPARSKKPRIN